MKVINVLLSILILLLAAASAVFSYFLFEKREQLVMGWEKMATTVNQTAAELDKGSGTKVASNLSADSLGHNKYAELDKKLPELKKQAASIIKQRDELSTAIRKIASIVEMQNIANLDEFKKLATYPANKTRVVRFVEEVKARQDDTIQMICSTARTVGVSISADDLKGSDYASSYRKLDSKIKGIKGRFNNYQSYFYRIANIVGAPRPNFSDRQYYSSIKNVTNYVQKLKNNYNSNVRALASAKSKVNSLNGVIRTKNGQIAGLNKTVVNKNGEIKRLQVIISGGQKDADKVAKVWQPGSPEARRAVQGKVIDVNRKYGFVVVDLGSKTLVKQKIGKKVNPVNPIIKNNVDMIVARGLESKNGEYIGKIKLVKIHDNCAIANVVPGSTGDKKVRVGDTVYFSNEQIAQMMGK
jgi:uncharacterized coiled-coil DUF342 family protein